MPERPPRKIQVLRSAVATDREAGLSQVALPQEAVDDLLNLAEAAANYFGYPRKAKPGEHREGRDKFNALIDQLDKFDFGTYAPDELRAIDYE